METVPTQEAQRRLLSWQTLGKWATTLLLIAILAAAIWFFSATEAGAKVRNDPRAVTDEVHHFIGRYPVTAPLIFLGIYTTVAVIALPVWWMQMLGGIGFGLYEGTFICLIGSTLATVIAMVLARWIAADWFHKRVESKLDQLKQMDETLGHNGFLFVMTVRLIPLLPFGLFNYALGVSTVSFVDAILGTLLGAMPVIALHVSVGAGYHPWHNWRFDLVLTTMTLILLLPLILRYLKPQWFKKIGVE